MALPTTEEANRQFVERSYEDPINRAIALMTFDLLMTLPPGDKREYVVWNLAGRFKSAADRNIVYDIGKLCR